VSYCTECGQDHHPENSGGGKTAEVRIAEINARRDIEVARIQRGEVRQETEAAIEMTEIETEGQVAVAAELAEAIAEADAPEAEPEPEPVVVTQDVGEPEPPAEDLAPPEVEHHREPAGAAKSRGFWPGA
jgi:hypothetical protein